MTILEGSSFSVAPPTPALEKRGSKIYVYFVKFPVTREEHPQFYNIKAATLLHSSESKCNRITKCNRVQFFIYMAASKQKWRLGLNRSGGIGHCSDRKVPLYHGWNGFMAELFVLLPLQCLNFQINVL